MELESIFSVLGRLFLWHYYSVAHGKEDDYIGFSLWYQNYSNSFNVFLFSFSALIVWIEASSKEGYAFLFWFNTLVVLIKRHFKFVVKKLRYMWATFQHVYVVRTSSDTKWWYEPIKFSVTSDKIFVWFVVKFTKAFPIFYKTKKCLILVTKDS